ncbi:MAG: Crp/Fnr family transcriptional regulator [Burkholderiaceae bacterium]
MHSIDTRPFLSADVLTRLCARGRVHTFARNTVVVSEGEPAETLYVVLAGELSVYVSDENGKEIELNRLGKNEFFGELMLANAVRTASVRTIEASRLCLVHRSDFEAFVMASPEIAVQLIHALIERVTALTSSVRNLALMDVYGRVARLLLDASIVEDEKSVVPDVSQREIADRVGASAAMVNRILKDLTTGGYIRVSRKRIELLKELPKRW